MNDKTPYQSNHTLENFIGFCENLILVNRFSISILFILFSKIVFSQTVLYTENMFNGGGGASGDAIATHETNNRFNEDGLTYSGTGDMRTTNVSSGYAGATGTWNVMLNAIGENFIMSGIDLSSCSSALTVSYGLRKATTVDNGSVVICEYSTAGSGGPWTAITFPALSIGAGTAIWYYRTSTSAIPTTANAFRWRCTDANINNIDDIKIECITGGCVPVSEPTTNSTSINITPGMTTASISLAGGNGTNRIAVMSTDCTITAPSDGTTYTANSIFGSGSTTAVGDYVVFNGSGNSFSVSGLSATTSYCIIIFENNGTSTCTDYLTTGMSSSSFITNATATKPYLTGIMINSCDATCAEGNNEIIFGTTADYALLVNTTNLDIRYGTTSPAPTTYTDAFSNVPATTANLNTYCPGTFIDGNGATIPIGAKFMVVRNTFCPVDYSWTNLCGTGPIYVIYSADASWVTGGNFDNSGTTLRYFRFNSTTTSAVNNTVDYNYIPNNNPSSGNGAFISLDSDGGAPVSYLNNGCVITLPITWGEFNFNCTEKTIELNWTTKSERNNDYFTVEESIDGENFYPIGKLKGNGNTSNTQSYSIQTEHKNILTYFRLKQTDYDGLSSYSDIIEANCIVKNEIYIYPNPTSGEITIKGYDKNAIISILDNLGRLIFTTETTFSSSSIDLSKNAVGIYFIQVKSLSKTETIKINVIR